MAPGELPIYLGLSQGLCRECRRVVPARYLADAQGVWLERLCPEHGPARARVAESLAWFQDALRAPMAPRPPAQARPRSAGCPESCGPCSFHAQACHLPVFSITNACDLRCPICFTYNRADRLYFMPPEEFQRQIEFVVRATGGTHLVNVTGGEPFMHPRLFELLALARRPEIGRVTVNTNGLAIAADPSLARRLAGVGAYAILSLDTLDRERSLRLHGRDIVDEKRRALDALEAAGVPTTLLMVLAGGINEADLAPVLELAMRREHVRSLTIQCMTYTGQGGGAFLPRRHLPVESVERMLAEASGGWLRPGDFMPLPSAHPLCYGVSYLVCEPRAGLHPFARLLSREVLARSLVGGYLLEPTAELETSLRDAIDRLWSEGAEPGLLRALKSMLTTIYPTGQSLGVAERQRRAESTVKTLYVHAHMDEDTWEVGRAMRCPDQVPVDAERLIGACNYNLFYRMRDERFWVEPGCAGREAGGCGQEPAP
ncbi:MAG TPA: radical SAM protein [Myxococcota bacterium]|nr:radical SAM protein [Myxococcota bacterium]HRY95804.1 radical SAM protein [Myxococcota bacterium]